MDGRGSRAAVPLGSLDDALDQLVVRARAYAGWGRERARVSRLGGGASLCREGACRRADGGGSRGVLRVDEPAVQQPHPQQVEDEQVLRVLQPVHGVKAHVDVEPAAELREERLRGEAGAARGCALGRANRASEGWGGERLSALYARCAMASVRLAARSGGEASVTGLLSSMYSASSAVSSDCATFGAPNRGSAMEFRRRRTLHSARSGQGPLSPCMSM